MDNYSHTNIERDPPSRLRDLENVQMRWSASARAGAHVQMHSTADMCKALI